MQSGNDACVAWPTIAGSEDNSAQMMNREGTTRRHEGIRASPQRRRHADPQHYTTASDLAKLTSALIRDFPAEYAKYYSIKEFATTRSSANNRLLWLDPTVDGVKTGHTDAAGYCLISSAKRPAPAPLDRPRHGVRCDPCAGITEAAQLASSFTTPSSSTPRTSRCRA